MVGLQVDQVAEQLKNGSLQIPEQMTAVVLDSYTGVDALRVEKRPVPKPGKDEVLVKMVASPINPSDLAVLEGYYGFKSTPPIVPGGEGSGTVIAVGPGMIGRYFLGKRVACLSQGKGDGMWAEYVAASVKGGVLPLNKSLSFEQGAMSFVNPLTASAFLALATKAGHKAIVLTAAASSLGQMVNRLFRNAGLQVINIVRRDAQVELLKEQGANVVLNSTETNFTKQLHDLCLKYDCHLAFDAVAGPMTGQLLTALPEHSKVTIYSALSFEEAQVSPDHIIFEDKALEGFWLGPYISQKNLIQILQFWRRAQKLMLNDLKSTIRAEYPLQDAKQAVKDYLSQMTGGKILLRPSP